MGILYVQKALGKNGRHFRCYKIRTMVLGADKNFQKFFERGSNQYGHLGRDERVTRLGKFLRRYFIDELPQLYNIYMKDIKLVGIRPMNEKGWRNYPDSLKERALRHLPGLMGVQYASRKKGDFEFHVRLLEQYLNEYEQNPAQTDKRYFHQILENIVLHRIRSS